VNGPVVGRGGYPIAELAGMARPSLMDRLDALAGAVPWPTPADVVWPGVTS
jgi:hypothetical protein